MPFPYPLPYIYVSGNTVTILIAFASVPQNSGQTPLLSHISCNTGSLFYEIIYTPKFQNLFSKHFSGFYLSNKFLNFQWLQLTC